MDLQEKVIQIVFGALENLNMERASDNKVPVAGDTLLLAEGGMVDSLELVSLVVDVETAIAERFGCEVSLTDDEAMSREESPFLSVAALCEYVCEVLQKNGN
jgi:acyl carrier protein